ncbi:hypothetical protein DESUT3_10030 [Desulfuromonas versatilis]|uniref:LptD C-terminal domain-containing protein n=2 Tax=Desulfuromonas versatilis TaxID=2802975 RepID=A0ABN6DXI3_9BACT|nr:hypothetical protein DESUT3_10030 [Desulfuromonas versatilis]
MLGIIWVGCPGLAAAEGRLFGAAEMIYGEHSAKEVGEKVLDADYFAQQYSLLYALKGKLLEGRAGDYHLSLGYEWNSLSGELNGEGIDVETGKILYRGDVMVAPGGLPFRLHLYSQDMIQSAFVDGRVPTLFESLPSDNFATPSPIVDIQNGQRIRSGATLMVGIRNGSYQGRYREVLSQFPRLLVDYSEVYVKDEKSLSPEHYRDRNLAFVSLNKKDNWFHYRLFEHRDYLNPEENYEESTYLLGTVDHTLQRQWINFTNWMKISADGSFTEGKKPNLEEDDFERYDLNMFAVARRSGWNASSFNTYSRLLEVGELRKSLEVPFYLNGELSRDTFARFRFVGSRDERLDLESGIQEDEDVLFASTRLETFRRERFILAPQLDGEVKQGDRGEGHALRARVEYYTNKAVRPRYDIFTAYSLARFEGTGDEGLETRFWEQELEGRIETSLSTSFRTGLGEELLYGTGTLDRTVSRHIIPKSAIGQSLFGTDFDNRDGDVFRSITTWFGEHRSLSRISNRVELKYDYLSEPEQSNGQFIANHSLRYDGREFLVNILNQLVVGEHDRRNSELSGGALADDLSLSSANASFLNRSLVRYLPNRSMEGSLRLDYEWRDEDEGSSSHVLGEQQYVYRIFKTNGIIRKLAEIEEKIEYERFTDAAGGQLRATVFTLTGDYYPIKILLLRARARYDIRSPENTHTTTWYLTTALNFEKLQVALDYAYGERSEGDTLPERYEHRWEVQVRKIF